MQTNDSEHPTDTRLKSDPTFARDALSNAQDEADGTVLEGVQRKFAFNDVPADIDHSVPPPEPHKLNREDIAPVPSEQSKSEHEHALKGREVESAGGGPDFAVDGRLDSSLHPPVGKPRGSPDTDKSLVSAGYEMAGAGSADGGFKEYA